MDEGMESDHLLVLYDGECPFCVSWVKFLLDRDGRDRLRFAALQSAWTRKFMAEKGLQEPELQSVLVWDGKRLYRESEAISRVAAALPGIWQVGRHLEAIPEDLRDKAYRFVAERRHRWFGRKHDCWMPKETDRRKFLDLSSSGQHHPGYGNQAGNAAGPHQRQRDL